jgi:hypothetical protein
MQVGIGLHSLKVSWCRMGVAAGTLSLIREALAELQAKAAALEGAPITLVTVDLRTLVAARAPTVHHDPGAVLFARAEQVTAAPGARAGGPSRRSGALRRARDL